MDVIEFRKKINPSAKISVEGKSYSIEEVVKFRLGDGSFYIKCFLAGGYVFADDENENYFMLVRGVGTPFQLPFGEKLEFDGKEFSFVFEAHAVAEEIWGQEIFKKGEKEFFWDYKAEDGSYLSLGVDERTGTRADFYGKIVAADEVKLF